MNRLKEIEAATRAKLAAAMEEGPGTTQRIATQDDYLYDKVQDAFWDTLTNNLICDRAVDASIPRAYWRVNVTKSGGSGEDDDGEGDEGGGKRKRRGRPKIAEKVIPPSQDIRSFEYGRVVEGATWWPGRPKLIEDWEMTQDGPAKRPGMRLFNTYSPPADIERTGAPDASRWVEHMKALWKPEEVEFMLDYFAHLVQKPDEKCNIGIVLSGRQGIGKDAALAPIKKAVGGWNTSNIDPDAMFNQFKPWIQSILLVIDEARTNKDEHRASSMYNIMKPFVAAPPFALAMDEKYKKPRYVPNLMRVIITTNDWMSLYIPEEDRRLAIMHSGRPSNPFGEQYFIDLFRWYLSGGYEAVREFLELRDISNFNPAGRVQQSAARTAIIGTWGADEEIDAAIDRLGAPDFLFSAELLNAEWDNYNHMINTMRSPRRFVHQMLLAGYAPIRPKDGQKRFHYVVNGKEQSCRFGFMRTEVFERCTEDEAEEIIKTRRARLKSVSGDHLTLVKGDNPPESNLGG